MLKTPLWAAQPNEWARAKTALFAICDVYGLAAQTTLPTEDAFEGHKVMLSQIDDKVLTYALEAIQELAQVPRQHEEAAQ